MLHLQNIDTYFWKMMSQFKQNPLSRRNLLQFGVGLIGTGSLAAWLGIREAASADASTPPMGSSYSVASTPGHTGSTLTPDQALTQLMEGNQRFVARRRVNPHQDAARLTEVATGQAPFAALLSCADSRVIPEIVFDQGIGDLFVVRVAGNIATIEDVASEEYAVGVLGAPLLVVMGHERCGAVHAALEQGELPGVIESLVYAIRPAIEASEGQPGDRLTNAVKANVRLQVQRLKTSPVVTAAIEQGKLKVVGAFYDLDNGEVSLVD